MDETKLLLGKLLGEVYRLQNNAGVRSDVGKAQIYGLLNGFENCIAHELEMIGFIPKEKVDAVGGVLEEYFNDDKKLESFKGYYDIEHALEDRGVDRSEAIRILTYFNAGHQFSSVIAKMDSPGSPSECRTFKLNEFEK